MKSASKALSIITVLYLLTGMLDVIGGVSESGLLRIVSVIYVACFVFAIAGLVAVFNSYFKMFRILSLWSIGVPCLFYATQDMVVQFPTLFNIPIFLSGSYANGECVRFGIDIIPGALFVTLWIVTNKMLESDSKAAEAR